MYYNVMDNASSVDVPIPEDVLQPLFSASNYPCLKEALETLIQSSRTADGRSDLASKNILSTVLRLTQLLLVSAAHQYLSPSLKLLRNLCAGEMSNQNIFIEQDGVKVVLMVFRFAGMDSDPNCGIIRLALQVLANVSLAGENHQKSIWSLFFPDEFLKLARIWSLETCDPLCMVIYSCCDGSPRLLQQLCADRGLAIVVEILHTTSAVGFREDWLKLLVSRVCLDEMQFSPLFSELSKDLALEYYRNRNLGADIFSVEQGFLLSIVSEVVNERAGEIIVPVDFALCILEIFRRSLSVVDFVSRGDPSLPASSTGINILGYSLTILRDICASDANRGSNNRESSDVVDTLVSAGLVELLLNLLRDLGPPERIKKVMKQDKNHKKNSFSSDKSCPYRGFRRDVVAVIGNCAYRRKHVQDEIKQRNGVLLLLQQCITDEDNPFLREWGIWSIRNLLEGNEENQKMVADLELQGSADVPELAGLGLKVAVDPKTHRAKLVNVSPYE